MINTRDCLSQTIDKDAYRQAFLDQRKKAAAREALSQTHAARLALRRGPRNTHPATFQADAKDLCRSIVPLLGEIVHPEGNLFQVILAKVSVRLCCLGGKVMECRISFCAGARRDVSKGASTIYECETKFENIVFLALADGTTSKRKPTDCDLHWNHGRTQFDEFRPHRFERRRCRRLEW